MATKTTKKPIKTVRANSIGKPASVPGKTRLTTKQFFAPAPKSPNPLVFVVGGAAVLAIILVIIFATRNQSSSPAASLSTALDSSGSANTNSLQTIVALMTSEPGSTASAAARGLSNSTPVNSAVAGAAVALSPITPQPNPTAFVAANSPCATATAPTTVPPANAPKQFKAPQTVIDPTHLYCAFVTTAHGVIVLELFPKSAPQHVNNFVFLAGQGFYDGLTWHRVLSGFMAQTGDPLGTGGGGPGYSNLPLEIDPALRYDKPGVLGMARTNDPNSAGSQFFITFGPAANLDGAYTIFGQVVKGLDVLNAITLRNPDDNPTTPGDTLISIRTLDVSTGK